MDFPMLIAFVALVSSLVAAAIEVFSIRHIDKRLAAESSKIEERGTVGEQFGDYLLAPSDDKEGSPTNLEVMTTLVGRQIAGSFRAAAQGIQSGDVRTYRSVEKAVLEGVQTPESKALIEFCDRIGLDRELAGVALEVLGKRGLLDNVLKNNGSGGQTSW